MWVDQKRTLLENRNRETWQLPVISKDGDYLGNVVAQIVEPQKCMVRYFLVFNRESDKHFLLPSDTVLVIDDKVYCNIGTQQIAQFPPYQHHIERNEELEIYRIIAQTPYWEYDLEP